MTNKEEEIVLKEYLKEDNRLHVKALLVAKNIKQIDIAKKYFIDPSEINKVVLGKRKTLHIRQAIAHALEMPYEKVWGVFTESRESSGT